MTITGPLNRTWSIINPVADPLTNKRAYYENKTWYRQKPFTGVPLQYDLKRSELTKPYKKGGDAPNHRAMTLVYGSTASLMVLQAQQKAYGDFKDSVYGIKAEMGINIAERQQSVDMIANNADRLRRAWNYMRRGDFKKFLRELRTDALPKHRRKPPRRKVWESAEGAANLWLEYHFGWEPVIQDIHTSVRILQREWPGHTAKGKGSCRDELLVSGKSRWNYDIKYRYRYLMQADWEISNPNLNLATQLGLTNPVAIAWEVVPFSFLVDWFIPVSQFLNQWSDFAGLSMKNTFTTRSFYAEGTQFYVLSNGALDPNSDWGHSRGWYYKRDLGITLPMFPVPKQLKVFSVVRTATAISLLLAVFKPSKHALKRAT